MKAYSLLVLVAMIALANCQSTQKRSSLAGNKSTDNVVEVEVTLISNPKHCPPCIAFDPIYKEMQEKYENDPKVKLIDYKSTAPFYHYDANGVKLPGFSPEWTAFREKHEIIKGVPIIRVRTKNKDGKHIGNKTYVTINGKNAEKDYYQFTELDKIEKDYIENYIKNSFTGVTKDLAQLTQQPATPTFKGGALVIGTDTFEIIRDENKNPIKLKQGGYVFDPSVSTTVSLSNGSKIISKKVEAGYEFEHCGVLGDCKTIHFPTDYALYPDLTSKDSTNVQNNVFTEVKVEFKLCGDTCEFKNEMAKLEDIVANKYEGLTYEQVKAALEELKESDEFKDVAIPDLKN